MSERMSAGSDDDIGIGATLGLVWLHAHEGDTVATVEFTPAQADALADAIRAAAAVARGERARLAQREGA